MTVKPVLVVTALIVSMMTSWEISGRPPVHGDRGEEPVLYPVRLASTAGFRWQVRHGDVRPASAANAASSVFHNRSREPLDLPESAVISRRRAPG